ncbi:uncharacterized protein LOC128213140 [Mya arenaria]|uniref:uncharacterized protein LOC128213140 n=1 Tax=Mya arenaria TaxID=6604 RepID=UPI0022E7761D|nr:uncharacterized protein LOC128213140 [Mya arenaria]XP_052774635.1 uncharacterized protein LOC128213140 [Mya arenaria]XP_052774636.1 uncharacterized protein LOC128213140 [Mya arenaria]
MDRDPEGKQAVSLRLSRVLGDIGVTREMVIWRRKTWLTIEKLATFFGTTDKTKDLHYSFFGSQSEGTTTFGMNSDIDVLNTNYATHVLLEMSEWRSGRIQSLLVLKNEHSPPQHCNMQMVRPDIPVPITLNMVREESKTAIADMEGRMLLKNSYFDILNRHFYGNEYVKNGPSRSLSKDYDSVNALSCTRLRDECMFFLRRPRPGHWPSLALLKKAKKTRTYFVPQGHAESSYPTLEWRFSTPHIERLLIFDLNMIKLKVYIVLKVLRITYFKPIFDDRLSTFHFKTALLFTVETYQPKIWKKKNILQCVIYCLTTLERWCRIHYCPHYTISGVDLFVGKLKKFELPRISAMLSDMIENISNYLVDIEMDRLGERMQMLTGTKFHIVNLSSKSDNEQSTLKYCLEELLKEFYNISTILGLSKEESASQLIIVCTKAVSDCQSFIKDTKQEFTKDVFCMLIIYLKSILVSVHGSVCIESRQNIAEQMNQPYQGSLDLSSGRLKFASMLYCTGQYEKAAAMLEQTEQLLHPDVWQLSFAAEILNVGRNRIFLRKLLDQPVSEIVKTFVLLSVTFFRQELNCVPKHLVYEMYRTFTPADIQQRKAGELYMAFAIIESLPFLYYLQYLTYRKLEQHDKKNSALIKLADYVKDTRDLCSYIETTLNVLGHCFELEDMLDLAWKCYSSSLRMFPYNNAARWHMAVIINKLINQ